MPDSQPVTSIRVSEQDGAIEILLEPGESYYGEWIKGEGGDIDLYRSREDNRVVGAYLPLRHAKVVVTRDCGNCCAVGRRKLSSEDLDRLVEMIRRS